MSAVLGGWVTVILVGYGPVQSAYRQCSGTNSSPENMCGELSGIHHGEVLVLDVVCMFGDGSKATESG